MIVNRTINASVVRYVEMLAHRDVSAKENWWGVDCALTRDTAASATVSNLAHLEGKTITCIADGIPRTGLVVASGSVTLPVAAEHVIAGLPYTYRVKTLRIDVQASGDKKKNVQGVTVGVVNSFGGEVGKDQFVNMDYTGFGFTVVGGLYTGDVDVNAISSWSKDGQIEIRGAGHYPMHITTLMPRLTVGGT